jgi:hypothetical protein
MDKTKNNNIKRYSNYKFKKQKNSNHKYLCYTNLLLIISILYLIYKK